MRVVGCSGLINPLCSSPGFKVFRRRAGTLALPEHDHQCDREFIRDRFVVMSRVAPVPQQRVAKLMQQDKQKGIGRASCVANIGNKMLRQFRAKDDFTVATEGVGKAASGGPYIQGTGREYPFDGPGNFLQSLCQTGWQMILCSVEVAPRCEY